jgi:DNA-binding NarL/FixJ family response regulator
VSTVVTRKKILLADDHPRALAQSADFLGHEYDIAGAVTNGLELLEAVSRLDPDVIVLDISMPVVDGFEAARRLKQAGCRSKLVFLTVWEDADFAREAMALGADAYVVKARVATDLMLAISEVLAERKFVSPTVTI